MPSPRISIVLPTWNGARDLARLLPALAAQVDCGEVEIVAIDSSSSDDTRDLLEQAGAHVEVIPQSEFRHGATRNRAADRARGELLVFLSQDVVPAGSDFLAKLTEVFDDPAVAGATARVLPHPGDDPLTARTVLDSPEAGQVAHARRLDPHGRMWDLPAQERVELLRFNNVASAIRSSVFHEIPFPDVPFGEDFAWAARALTAGHTLRFVPESVAYHAHEYSPRQAFERYRIDAAFHREIHGHRLRPTVFSVARGIGFEVREDWRYLKRTHAPAKARYLMRSVSLRGAQVLGQFWGSRGWGPAFWPDSAQDAS